MNREEIFYEKPHYLSPEFLEDCFKLLEKNNKCFFYRKLISFPNDSPDKRARKEARKLQNEFRYDVERQLESFFRVKSIYQIEEEFGPMVQLFMKDYYVPNEELIRRMVETAKEIFDIRLELCHFNMDQQRESCLHFQKVLHHRLESSVSRQINSVILNQSSPRIRIFIEAYPESS